MCWSNLLELRRSNNMYFTSRRGEGGGVGRGGQGPPHAPLGRAHYAALTEALQYRQGARAYADNNRTRALSANGSSHTH